MRVHILDEAEQSHLQYLGAALDSGVELTSGEPVTRPEAIDVMVAGRPRPALLQAATRLRALVVPWAGLPPETRGLLASSPHIAVHNLHHNAGATAEMALALLLAAAKWVIPLDRALRRNDWRPRYAPNLAIPLDGRTALVLGYGAIGQRLARMCRGLGMPVLATRRSAVRIAGDGVAQVHPPAALRDLLPRAQALLITLPLTDETRGLLGAAELALLPPEAVLVNVGRGPIVDEAALYAALKSRQLHSAGLDVWYNYPKTQLRRLFTPPSRYPFGRLDNVVLSPHRAGDLGGEDTERARMEALATVINALARGEEAPNRVDVERGY